MAGKSSGLAALLRNLTVRLRVLLKRDIWQSSLLNERTPRARAYAALRIASITGTGLIENKVASRAGALSYSSLLGLGPLVAIAVVFSGFVLKRSDPNLAVDALNRALMFIAPQLDQYNKISQEEDDHAPDESTQPEPSNQPTSSGHPQTPVKVNPELVQLLNNFIAGSQSKAIGLAGVLVLIVIVIQLFTSVENAFNTIWGVRRGRSWLLRIVFYWTAVTLGAVLTFAGLTLLSASTFVAVIENLPMGAEIRRFFTIAAPLISVGVLVLMLTLFYRVIPNTKVKWIPAVVGAVFVVVLLYANNLLAFLYFRRVVLQQSLYGSVGFLPILMVGMYVFWFIILVGGQITYAIQNANYRSSQTAWNDLNHDTRETLSLLVLTLICRRFRDCATPYTASQLAELIKIPTQILNECLNRLIDLDLIINIPPESNDSSLDYRYQPARPLEKIAIGAFMRDFGQFGEAGTGDMLISFDPVVEHYRRKIDEIREKAFAGETIATLTDQFTLAPAQESANGS